MVKYRALLGRMCGMSFSACVCGVDCRLYIQVPIMCQHSPVDQMDIETGASDNGEGQEKKQALCRCAAVQACRCAAVQPCSCAVPESGIQSPESGVWAPESAGRNAAVVCA